jgi:hypothetical protein
LDTNVLGTALGSRLCRGFPRYLRRQLEVEDAAKVEAIVRQVEPEEPEEVLPSARGDDWRRRRGLPIVGPGIGGTSIGTDPVRALLTKETRRHG